MAPLPSWIQGEPSQFSDAYAHGAQQGLALAEMRDRISARNQQRQMQLQELQDRAEERQAAAAERAKEFDARQGLSREEMASREKLAGTAQDALKEYRNAQLDLHKAGLGLQSAHLDMMRNKVDETGAPLGGPEVLTDPETQARVGLRIPISKSSAHFQADKGFGKEGTLSDVQKAQIRQIDMLEKDNRKAAESLTTDDVTKAALSRRLLQLDQQREAIMRPKPVALPANPAVAPMAPPAPAGPLGAVPGAPVPTAPIPMPNSKAALVVGQTYQTRKGPAKWTGEHFESIQ
jgi:hypothetical protein